MINIDFNRIAFRINRVIQVRLRTRSRKVRLSTKKSIVNKHGKIDINKVLKQEKEQEGKCFITGNTLRVGEMESHHITPKKKEVGDNYRNITWISTDIHKLIHATTDETIKKYMDKFQLNDTKLIKLNKLRQLAGNCIVER